MSRATKSTSSPIQIERNITPERNKRQLFQQQRKRERLSSKNLVVGKDQAGYISDSLKLTDRKPPRSGNFVRRRQLSRESRDYDGESDNFAHASFEKSKTRNRSGTVIWS